MDPNCGHGRLPRSLAALGLAALAIALPTPALAAGRAPLPKRFDAGLGKRCETALRGGAAAAFCNSKHPAKLSAARRKGRGSVRLAGGTGLKPGSAVRLSSRSPGRHAQLALVYATSAGDVYVRFSRFVRRHGPLRGVVKSRATRGGRLVVSLRVSGRSVSPRVQHRLARPAAAAVPSGAPPANGAPAGDPAPRGPCVPVTGLPGGDDAFNTLFATCGPGWTGGDGTYSVPLPDGRTAWLFGDSWLGAVNDDGGRPAGQPFINNAMIVQDGRSLTTIFGGAQDAPRALVAPGDPSQWYWPADGTVEGSELRVLMLRMRHTGSGPWDFAYAGTDVASFSLPGMRLESVRHLLDDQGVTWGSAILEDDAFTYVYGVESIPWHKYLHVARAPRDGLAGAWQFFDGSGWSSDPAASARVLDHVSDQLTVVKWNGGYRVVSQGDMFSRDVYVYGSTSPASGWSAGKLVYSIADPGPNLFTYGALAHPEAQNGGGILLSYNVNTNDGQDMYRDVRSYRPRFVRVPASALDG